jgi:hypothetical protein
MENLNHGPSKMNNEEYVNRCENLENNLYAIFEMEKDSGVLISVMINILSKWIACQDEKEKSLEKSIMNTEEYTERCLNFKYNFETILITEIDPEIQCLVLVDFIAQMISSQDDPADSMESVIHSIKNLTKKYLEIQKEIDGYVNRSI